MGSIVCNQIVVLLLNACELEKNRVSRRNLGHVSTESSDCNGFAALHLRDFACGLGRYAGAEISGIDHEKMLNLVIQGDWNNDLVSDAEKRDVTLHGWVDIAVLRPRLACTRALLTGIRIQ